MRRWRKKKAVLLPWTGDMRDPMLTPWLVKDLWRQSAVQIFNQNSEFGEILAATRYTSENKERVMAANFAVVDAMKAVTQVRGGAEANARMGNDVSWDYESAAQISTIFEALPVIDLFMLFNEGSQPAWAQTLFELNDNFKKIQSTKGAFSQVGSYKISDGNEVTMAITRGDDPTPLVRVRPLAHRPIIANNQQDISEAATKLDALEAKELGFGRNRALHTDAMLQTSMLGLEPNEIIRRNKIEKKRSVFKGKQNAAFQNARNELRARNIGWIDVILPTLNFSEGFDIANFPKYVKAFREGLPTLLDMGISLYDQGNEASSQAMLDTCASLQKAFDIFDRREDRNMQLFDMRSKKRVEERLKRIAHEPAFPEVGVNAVKRARPKRRNRREKPEQLQLGIT